MLQNVLSVGTFLTFTDPVIAPPAFANGDFVPVVHVRRGTFEGVTFEWLPYWAGAITTVPFNGVDIFTGPFGGCFIAVYRVGANICVAHIGTGPTDADAQTIAVKNRWLGFARNHGADLLVAYNPFRQMYPGLGTIPVPRGEDGTALRFTSPLYAFVTGVRPYQCYGVVLWPQLENFSKRRIVKVTRLLPMKRGLELQNMLRLR